jgi:hypothetical protein
MGVWEASFETVGSVQVQAMHQSNIRAVATAMTAYAFFPALALFVMTSNAAPSSRPNFVIM